LLPLAGSEINTDSSQWGAATPKVDARVCVWCGDAQSWKDGVFVLPCAEGEAEGSCMLRKHRKDGQ